MSAPEGRVVYVKTLQLSLAEMEAIFAPYGESTITALDNVGLTVDYEVGLHDVTRLPLAAAIKHDRITFVLVRNAGLPAIHSHHIPRPTPDPGLNLPSSGMDMSGAPLNLPHSQGKWFPALTCDNLPYWTTHEDIHELFSKYGTVAEIKFALNDMNGCHFGCCQVLMSSHEEMEKAEQELDGYKVNGSVMVVGVLNSEGRQINTSKVFIWTFFFLILEGGLAFFVSFFRQIRCKPHNGLFKVV